MDEKRNPVSGMAPPSHYSKPVWASARKDMVGGTLGSSRLWFTVAQGIVSEVYYPRIDIPQLKDLGFIVADGCGYWEEVRPIAEYELEYARPGILCPSTGFIPANRADQQCLWFGRMPNIPNYV